MTAVLSRHAGCDSSRRNVKADGKRQRSRSKAPCIHANHDLVATARLTALGWTPSARAAGAHRHTVSKQLLRSNYIAVVTTWPPESSPLRLRAANPGDDAIPNQIPLELGDRGQDVE